MSGQCGPTGREADQLRNFPALELDAHNADSIAFPACSRWLRCRDTLGRDVGQWLQELPVHGFAREQQSEVDRGDELTTDFADAADASCRIVGALPDPAAHWL